MALDIDSKFPLNKPSDKLSTLKEDLSFKFEDNEHPNRVTSINYLHFPDETFGKE